MIRLASNQIILTDGVIVELAAAEFHSLRKLNHAIIHAVFEKFQRAGHPVSSCYFKTGEICGMSDRTIENVVAGRA